MRRRSQDQSLSLRLLADWELKMVRQQEHIANLTRKGGSTKTAEAELKRLQGIVTGLRNHADIMRELLAMRGTRVANHKSIEL